MGDDPPNVADSVSYDPETDTYRASFDAGATDPSLAVVRMLACVCEKAPTDLEPLQYAVDPAALNRLLRPRRPERESDRAVAFTYEEHRVTVLSYGLIKVTPLASSE